ncbi:MAG TPA: thermonuclease family protein [Pilimelia sp.]|nr:thermonuclease family protein [Pilimelia sp.]
MPLNLIKGQFRILRSQPDGDSIRFYPIDPAAFTKLRLPAHANRSGGAQLRLDAIDALETHYAPRVHGAFLHHQPLALAHAAADALLELAGFAAVTRDHTETVVDAAPEHVDGYILTRFADKYGRAVSLAYVGRTDRPDLASVRVDTELLQASLNYQLIAAGLAYPTYYSKLYPDLRHALTVAVEKARANQAGVWADDLTTSGATITELADLVNDIVIMPKLFRRLIDYIALGAGDVCLDGFVDFLATRDDRLFVISTGHATGLDTIVEVMGQTLRLTRPPDDLIFIEA